MANRTLRKKRNYGKHLTFKELVRLGREKKLGQTSEEHTQHVHSEHCNHTHEG